MSTGNLVPVAGHIGWLLQEWSQSERLCGERWVLVACQPLGTRYLRTPQESSLARHRAPSSAGVAGFIGVHSSWKCPAKFPKVCSYSWEEIRRQTEKLHGRQKEELPRETAHDLNCSSILSRSPLNTQLRWKSAGALNSTRKLRPRTAPGTPALLAKPALALQFQLPTLLGHRGCVAKGGGE